MNTKLKKSGQLPQGSLSHAFLLFLLIFTVFIDSCSEKGLNTQPKSTGNIIKNSKDFQYTTISYEQFLRQLKKSNNIELLNAVDSKKSGKKATNVESGIEIIPTDSVKRISINGHTTYTLPLQPPSKYSTIFQNLVIDSSATGVEILHMTYYPEESWIKDFKEGKKTDFRGTVGFSNYNLTNGGLPNGRTKFAPVCTTILVLREINYSMCCHNTMNHVDCDCAAYNAPVATWTYYYDSYTMCTSVPDASGGAYTGGEGTSGGGTNPYPGSGYEPCSGGGGGGPARVSILPPCEEDPGQGPTPTPGGTGNPVPNSSWADLQNELAAVGLEFHGIEISFLNNIAMDQLDRIKKLVRAFKAVRNAPNDIYRDITNSNLKPEEQVIINNLGNNNSLLSGMHKLAYIANAYSAQLDTQIKYLSLFAGNCAFCKGNSFKHALFLITNAGTWGLQTAQHLAAAHEINEPENMETQMDKANNAAAAAFYTANNESQSATLLFNGMSMAANGFVFVKNDVLVSSIEHDPFM